MFAIEAQHPFALPPAATHRNSYLILRCFSAWLRLAKIDIKENIPTCLLDEFPAAISGSWQSIIGARLALSDWLKSE